MALPLMQFVADFTAGPPALPGINSVSLSPALEIRGVDTNRGRQYELDSAQSGTLTLDALDPSEVLNPINTASPFNTGGNSILPYRCLQIGAWINPSTLDLTGNLLNTANTQPGASVPFDPTFEGGTLWTSVFGSAATQALSTAQAWQGTHSLAVTAPSAGAVAGWAMWTVPGVVYTVSAYVYVPASHTVSMTVAPYGGSAYGTATSSTTGAWQRLSVTATATTAVARVTVAVATGSLPATVYVDAVQVEVAGAPSPFTTTGPTYRPLWTGYIERYPQGWDTGGRRGVRSLQAVDALTPLANVQPTAGYQTTVLADSPSVLIPYDDSAIPQRVLRPMGGYTPLGYESDGTNSGSVQAAGDSTPDGTPAAVVTQPNVSPVTVGDATMTTYLGTYPAATVMSMSPQSFTLEVWIKWSSGTIYLGAAQYGAVDRPPQPYGPSYYAGWYTSSGVLCLHYADPNGNSVPTYTIGTPQWTGFPDGQWHHLALVFPGGSTVQSIVDGVAGGVPGLGFTPSTAVGLNNFFIGATVYNGDPTTTLAVANMAAYPRALTLAQIQAHYQRGTGFLGERSGARVARLLSQYWGGPSVVAPGQSTMSPDFYYYQQQQTTSADGSTTQQSLLQSLQDIQATESGLLWVDAGGTVHFDDRETRLTRVSSATSQWTFSDLPADLGASALPYADLSYDYDPTYVYSTIQLTDANGAVITTTDADALAAYGERVYSATSYAADDWQVSQQGLALSTRYAAPAGAPGSTAPPRIETLVLDPASHPALWPAVLGMDIGTRVTVRHMTSAGVLIQGDYYVEQIAHSGRIAQDSMSWRVTLQLSPAWNSSAFTLGTSLLGGPNLIVY